MKILCVFGTRPEAIKLAPVIQELRRRSVDTALQTVVCVTAQTADLRLAQGTRWVKAKRRGVAFLGLVRDEQKGRHTIAGVRGIG